MTQTSGLPATATDTFYRHLDCCDRCRNQPFNLCLIGAIWLKKAAEEGLTPDSPKTCPTCGSDERGKRFCPFPKGGYVEGQFCYDFWHHASAASGAPPNPMLAELLEKTRDHVMPAEEKEAQRQSWVRGEMGLDRGGEKTSPFGLAGAPPSQTAPRKQMFDFVNAPKKEGIHLDLDDYQVDATAQEPAPRIQGLEHKEVMPNDVSDQSQHRSGTISPRRDVVGAHGATATSEAVASLDATNKPGISRPTATLGTNIQPDLDAAETWQGIDAVASQGGEDGRIHSRTNDSVGANRGRVADSDAGAVASVPLTAEQMKQLADEFSLVQEDGEWYLDSAVFGQHRRFNKIVTALIAAQSRTLELEQRIEDHELFKQQLKEALAIPKDARIWFGTGLLTAAKCMRERAEAAESCILQLEEDLRTQGHDR